MEVNFLEHQTFLLYITIFILFCFSCMLIIVAAQLDEFNRRVVKERDDLLGLLGRNAPEQYAVTDKNILLINMLQERINKLKETSVRLNEEMSKRTGVLVTERPKRRYRKIFVEKVFDLE